LNLVQLTVDQLIRGFEPWLLCGWCWLVRISDITCDVNVLVKKYSPDVVGPLRSMTLVEMCNFGWQTKYKQFYTYSHCSKSSSYISSEYEYRFICAAYHFKISNNQPPFERHNIVYLLGAWQHQEL